jgi:hypothetical protein
MRPNCHNQVAGCEPLHFDQATNRSPTLRLLSSHLPLEEGSAVSRLIIAIVVVAIWAVALVQNAANGTPGNSSRYQYGSR